MFHASHVCIIVADMQSSQGIWLLQFFHLGLMEVYTVTLFTITFFLFRIKGVKL